MLFKKIIGESTRSRKYDRNKKLYSAEGSELNVGILKFFTKYSVLVLREPIDIKIEE